MAMDKEPRINLLRYQQEKAKERYANIRLYLMLGMIILLSITAMGGAWWMQKQNLQAVKAKNEVLQQQVDELTSYAVSASSKEDVSEYNQRQTMITTLEKLVKAKSKNFEEIYLLSIPGVTIGKMDVKANDNLVITAYCSSQAVFIKFLDEIRNLDFIIEIKNISSKYNEKTGEVSFNVTLVWGEVK